MFTAWRDQHRNRQRLAALRPRLKRLALVWCGEHSLADDLVQESLTRALSNLPSLKREQALEGWAFTILANCFRDHCRRNRSADPFEECIDHTQPTAEERLSTEQITERVRLAVKRLPPAQRQVLTLVDLESCSYAEVARILAIPVGTVMSRLSRARQRLKQLLADELTGAGVSRLERVK